MSDVPSEPQELYEGIEHIYRPGRFLKIAESPSERISLNLVLCDGGPEGPRAGEIYYLSMDPVQSCMEPLTSSFDALLDWIAAEPARFLNEIGYCGCVQGVGAEKGWFGDPPERYVADIGGQPSQSETMASPEPPGPSLFD